MIRKNIKKKIQFIEEKNKCKVFSLAEIIMLCLEAWNWAWNHRIWNSSAVSTVYIGLRITAWKPSPNSTDRIGMCELVPKHSEVRPSESLGNYRALPRERPERELRHAHCRRRLHPDNSDRSLITKGILTMDYFHLTTLNYKGDYFLWTIST
jgi:hypothetical protein